MVHGGQGQGLFPIEGAAVGVEGDLILLQLHPVGQGQLVVRSAQEGGVQGTHQVTGGDEQLRAVLEGEGHAVQVFGTHVLQVAEGSPVQAAPQQVVGHVPVVKAGDVRLEDQGGVLQLAPGLVGRVLVVQNGLDGALGQVELHHAVALVHAVGGGHGAVVLGSGGGVILVIAQVLVLAVVLVVAQVLVLVVVLAVVLAVVLVIAQVAVLTVVLVIVQVAVLAVVLVIVQVAVLTVVLVIVQVAVLAVVLVIVQVAVLTVVLVVVQVVVLTLVGLLVLVGLFVLVVAEAIAVAVVEVAVALAVVVVAVVVLQSLDGRQSLLLLGCQRGGGQGAQAQGKGHRGDRCVFLKVCHGSFSFKSQNLRMKSLAAGLA